jgi:endonuclease YncB( thermonuclease family)
MAKDLWKELTMLGSSDKNVNLEMVRAGLAEVYRGPPAKGLNLEPY